MNFKQVHKIRGMLSFFECMFLNGLTRKTALSFGDESVLCEIGSFCGKSTVCIASALTELNKGVLYAIDWHQGSPSLPGFNTDKYKSTYDEYLENLRRFGVGQRVTTIKKMSKDAADSIPSKIHFLWIDGDHEYETVKKDFEDYQGKLVGGGFLLFHDACWTGWEDPFRVISEQVLDNPAYNFYGLMWNTMVFKKEANHTCGTIKYALRYLCPAVSGENRSLFKRMCSAILLRITSLWTWIACRP